MRLQTLYRDVFILITILLQTTANPVDSTRSENSDFNKMRVDPTRLRYFEILNTHPNIIPKNNNNSVIPDPRVGETNFKKWQISQMDPRRYEIVNMLWKKRKEFDKTGMSTFNYRPTYYPLFKAQFPINPTSHFARLMSTPSFFEFYYLDENYNGVNISKGPAMQRIKNIDVLKTNNGKKIFAFHINEPLVPPYSSDKFVRSYGRKDNNIPSTPSSLPVAASFYSGPPKKIYLRMPYKRTPKTSAYSTVISSVFDKKPYSTKIRASIAKSLNEETNQNKILNISPTADEHRNLLKSTTVNDKIKFFEIYDKLTPLPDCDRGGNLINLDTEKVKKSTNHQVTSLQHINTSINIEKLKSNQASIYGTENNTNDLKDLYIERKTSKPIKKSINNSNDVNSSLKDGGSEEITPRNKLNKLAIWSENSFMAVYIYEPSQVRCDAAGISPHWLVTSGSCLSRHHKNPGGEGRSAFVAFCGPTWWNAERIAYVKYSVVHPNYHQRDAARKYMYNIGLVQVVNAMTTCPGWSPISLMSHQFTTDPNGSTAYSVGWGLDRYNVLYPSSNLPRYPLLIYENQVFSDSCPGSLGYTQVKHEFGEEAVKNVYCLSLPPYSGEAKDPIHGSMLIVEGKLCAIFLQEERRSSGRQCAEYTGTWRLSPWVNRVARDMDYADPFPFEI